MIASTALPLLALVASLAGAAPLTATVKSTELKFLQEAKINATDALAELEKLQAAAALKYGNKLPLPAPVGNWTDLHPHVPVVSAALNATVGASVSASAKVVIGDPFAKPSESHSHSSTASHSSVSKAPTSSKSATASKITPTSSVTKSSSTVSKSTAAASAVVSLSATVKAEDSTLLALHDMFRAEYGAGSVKWNDTLAAYAQKAADTCKYGHTNGPYGENIAAGVGGGYDVTAGFNSWATEAAKYNWSAPGYSDATGHFTQLVWKATTQIGCGVATCADGTIFTNYHAPSTYIVCEYQAPGNVVGDNNKYFIENVGKKLL